MSASASLPADEALDYAERWFRDGLCVVRPSFSVMQTTVDMTHATEWLEELRHEGVHATSTHLLVYATARALSSNRKLHQIVAGNRRHYPAHVDIGLSITGESFVAPVLVIERAEEKSVAEIVSEVDGAGAGSPAGRSADAADPAAMGTARPIRFHAARDPAGALHELDVQAEGRRHISSLDGAGGLGDVLSVQHLPGSSWRGRRARASLPSMAVPKCVR